MRVLNTRAVSTTVQLALGGAEEKRKPGGDGTTTLYDTIFPVGLIHDWVNGLMTGANSWKEPAQPWHGSIVQMGEFQAYLAIREVKSQESHLDPLTFRG